MRAGRARLSAFFLVAMIAGAFAIGQEGVDMRMVDAGFIMRPADTPEKLERLKLLPARKFIGRTRRGGHYFLYADPDICKCVFVGSQAALQTYRDMVTLPPNVGNVPPSGAVPMAEMVNDMDSDVSNLIGDDDFIGFPF